MSWYIADICRVREGECKTAVKQVMDPWDDYVFSISQICLLLLINVFVAILFVLDLYVLYEV